MGIYDTIQKLETMRKRKNMYILMLIVPFVFIFFVAMFGGMFGGTFLNTSSSGAIIGILMVLFMIFVVLGGIQTAKIDKEFKALYKDTFVVGTLREIFPDVFYDYQNGFNADYVRNFGLTRLGNRFRSEDYMTATYKGIKFEQADVTIQYHSSGKNSHTTTYFKGRMFTFVLPGKTVNSVKIYDEHYMYRADNQFRMNKINMENIEFNKNFDVLSNVDMDAFYVLTPQMMEKIFNLKHNFRNVGLHFMGNRLFVGLPYATDSFDAKFNRKIDYVGEKNAVLRDAKIITDIIDILGMMKENAPVQQNQSVANNDINYGRDNYNNGSNYNVNYNAQPSYNSEYADDYDVNNEYANQYINNSGNAVKTGTFRLKQ